MPSERVYAVDFKGGNLTPSLDTKGWGDMRVGVGADTSSSADPQGLELAVTAAGAPIGIGAFPVTCQFRPNGTRLNTPAGLQGDQAAMLITPLDYGDLTPGRFTLEHHFCGVNAANRYAVGFGTLNVGPPIRKFDQRVYSNEGLSGGQQDWIGALGVILVTLNGAGEIGVRLRSFAVSLW